MPLVRWDLLFQGIQRADIKTVQFGTIIFSPPPAVKPAPPPIDLMKDFEVHFVIDK